MTWEITPEVVPTQVNASYYWANQLSSQHGGHAIYTGIQPRTRSIISVYSIRITRYFFLLLQTERIILNVYQPE